MSSNQLEHLDRAWWPSPMLQQSSRHLRRYRQPREPGAGPERGRFHPADGRGRSRGAAPTAI